MASAPLNVAEAPEPDTDQSPYQRVEALIPAGSPLHGITSLEELGEWLASNILVPIDETRLNPVLGAGNPNADLMVIGEAPGAEEDKRGEAFVGRAGKLLDQILEAIGFSRAENVYICNILKCRPPGNRNPSTAEADNCREYLDGQIAAVKPDYIVCWGTVAAQHLLRVKDSIGRMRKRFFVHGNAKVLCTYHPSYLLRNPAAKKEVWADMKFLMQEMGIDLDAEPG
ncbi:MAG: uracil-DNA glycosylase [Bacteroidetes bacterium]|nr:uracil-DNA glycosylase [Bacteroidota bacterium]